jgi:hypothetical protein
VEIRVPAFEQRLRRLLEQPVSVSRKQVRPGRAPLEAHHVLEPWSEEAVREICARHLPLHQLRGEVIDDDG